MEWCVMGGGTSTSKYDKKSFLICFYFLICAALNGLVKRWICIPTLGVSRVGATIYVQNIKYGWTVTKQAFIDLFHANL